METKESKSRKPHAPNWTSKEEEQLAKSWIHVFSDPETATNQSSEMFFKKVANHFNSKIDLHQRDWEQVQTCWNSLRTSTLKFSSCFAKIKRGPQSGCNLVDMMRDAKALYTSDDSKKREFNSELAWEVLRTEPKWIVPPPAPIHPSSSAVSITSSAPPTDSKRPSSTVRPLGKKTSKRIRLSQAKREEGIKDDKLAEIKAEERDINSRRVSAMEEANRLTQEMMGPEVMAKEIEILERDESTIKSEVARKSLRRMKAQILLKYEKMEAEGTEAP